jgi:hypothetical protein
MNVFMRLINNPFAGKCLKPSKADKGMPIDAAIKRAVPETLRDKNIMPKSSASRLNISKNAFLKPSIIKSTFYFAFGINN